MNLRFQIIDTDTGEVVITRYKDYAMQFAVKGDAGFRTCVEWCMSCVRGVRQGKHKHLELRIGFATEADSLPLPFGNSIDKVREVASSYVY